MVRRHRTTFGVGIRDASQIEVRLPVQGLDGGQGGPEEG
jgi:hypothetical protein